MRPPKFTLEDVACADRPATFKRAQMLYRSGKVGEVVEKPLGYSATVLGTQPYVVSISLSRVDNGDCNCYLGQHGRMCKHLLALALKILDGSGKGVSVAAGPQAPEDLASVRPIVNAGMNRLRAYHGPSKIWFSYQRTLATGASMIAQAVSGLPPTKENAAYLWAVIIRIDKKLVNGVDDSDGVVGECVARITQQLAAYAQVVPALVPVIKQFCSKKTNFCFEAELRDSLAAVQV